MRAAPTYNNGDVLVVRKHSFNWAIKGSKPNACRLGCLEKCTIRVYPNGPGASANSVTRYWNKK